VAVSAIGEMSVTEDVGARRPVAAILAMMIAAGGLFASTANAAPVLPPDLARAAADYDRAQIKSDGAELNRLLADDYTLVNGGCEIYTKAQFVADSTKPGSTMEPYEVEHEINKVWADGAVLSGEVNLKGVDGGKPYTARARFADIWRKRDGKWQVVFTEVTRFPAAAAKAP
jgi:hypothetical protein